MHKSRGQIFSTDAIMSAVVFIIVLAFLLSVWNINSIRLAERMATDEIERNAFAIVNTLADTPGMPSDWPTTNATTFGLLHESGTTDTDKINSLFLQNITTIKESFNVDRYNLRIDRIQNGTVTQSIGDTYGNETTRVSVSRLILLNNDINEIRVILWA